MHAFLITGSATKFESQIQKIANEHKAKILPTNLQKIEDIRTLRKLVKLSFSKKTLIYIKNIDTSTLETQNAFLKNLEEPQKNLVYVLTAENINNVIPTILSRCQVIKAISTNNGFVLKKEVKQYVVADMDKRFSIIEKIKERPDAISFVEGLIYYQKGKGNYKDMEVYLYTLKNLKGNGNVSLQLTNMLVSS